MNQARVTLPCRLDLFNRQGYALILFHTQLFLKEVLESLLFAECIVLKNKAMELYRTQK